MDNTAENAGILTSVIRAFLDAEGSSLQFNLIDRNALLDARIHPDDHRNLFVRVCGYSAVFVYLSPSTQNEILERAIR
jgi:formate C-acetyltransferase